MEDTAEEIPCFICHDHRFDTKALATNLSQYGQHLLTSHSVLIPLLARSDNDLDDLRIFLSRTGSLEQVSLDGRCVPFLMTRFDRTVQYFIIDAEQMKDDDIKALIEKNFLERILDQAQIERQNQNPEFNRQCLFCKKIYAGNRAELFDHLFHDHNFFLGHPDNIFGANEFLDTLDGKLKKLLCLYCEKQFTGWKVLKEHMRKKGHKTLNPNNREYDKYYLINYLCTDKHWLQIKKENDFYVDNFDDDDWCDWIEDNQQQQLECDCLFCPFRDKFDSIRRHLNESHRFDFDRLYKIEDFYHRIKMVNFIRKTITDHRQCHRCLEQFSDMDELREHLKETGHESELPGRDAYDSPEYYFPALDDDCLLLFLDQFDDDE